MDATPAGFPKLGVPLRGVPIIRIIVLWGLYWVPLFWETATLLPLRCIRCSGVTLKLGFRVCLGFRKFQGAYTRVSSL